jgi:uncharacterized membrane protein YeaQ/YmgE (transglycosylase-associated protein family)
MKTSKNNLDKLFRNPKSNFGFFFRPTLTIGGCLVGKGCYNAQVFFGKLSFLAIRVLNIFLYRGLFRTRDFPFFAFFRKFILGLVGAWVARVGRSCGKAFLKNQNLTLGF